MRDLKVYCADQLNWYSEPYPCCTSAVVDDGERAKYRSWWMGLTSPLWLQSIHQGTTTLNYYNFVHFHYNDWLHPHQLHKLSLQIGRNGLISLLPAGPQRPSSFLISQRNIISHSFSSLGQVLKLVLNSHRQEHVSWLHCTTRNIHNFHTKQVFDTTDAPVTSATHCFFRLQICHPWG